MMLILSYFFSLNESSGYVPVILLFVILAAPEWPLFAEERYQINTVLRQQHFDFLTWGARALAAKGEAQLTGAHKFLDESEQRAFVLAFLDDLAEARMLERQISSIYTDPGIDDPDEQSAELQIQVDNLRMNLEKRQPIAESILEDQVSTILNHEDLRLLGQTWPPVKMQLTSLPKVLIVSPRDEIKQLYKLLYRSNLNTSQALERINEYKSEDAATLAEFISESQRGLTK